MGEELEEELRVPEVGDLEGEFDVVGCEMEALGKLEGGVEEEVGYLWVCGLDGCGEGGDGGRGGEVEGEEDGVGLVEGFVDAGGGGGLVAATGDDDGMRREAAGEGEGGFVA